MDGLTSSRPARLSGRKRLHVGTRAEREENKQRLDKYERELKAQKESLEGLVRPFRELVLSENLEKLDENTRAAIRKARRR